MSRPDLCSILVVLDRSGSMAGIKKEIEGGFNQWVADQRALPGTALLTLVQFDLDETETIFTDRPLAVVPPLVLIPRGLTPLLDAVGRSVTQAIERQDRQPEADRPGKTLVVILTDGQENSSREWTKTHVRDLLTAQQAKGWGVIYLGVGVEAFLEAGTMGIAAMHVSSTPATPTGVHAAYASANVAASSYRSGGLAVTHDPNCALLHGGIACSCGRSQWPVPNK